MAQLIEHKGRRRSSAIDLTPLVDVVFLLLIFFLVTSQFAQPVASLELPSGKSGAPPDESAIRVELGEGDELRVNGVSVTDASYESALEEAMAASPARKVRFYGDRRINYGRFVELLDRARELGIDDFSIVKTQEPPDESPTD